MRYVDENVKNEMGLYLADYLIESGCTTLDGFEMRNNISCKVSCPNPAHGDNPPSAYYLGNWRYGNPVVHCRSCGNVWDLFRLIGVRENLPEFSQQVERAWELYGSRDRSAATRTVPKNLQAVREEVATEDKVRIQQYILNSQQNILQTFPSSSLLTTEVIPMLMIIIVKRNTHLLSNVNIRFIFLFMRAPRLILHLLICFPCTNPKTII